MFLEILQNSQENICARVSILIKLQASVTVYLNKKYQHFQKVNTNYKEIVSFHRQKVCRDVEMNIKCLWITYWYAILKWKRLLDFNRSFRRYITIGHNNAVYCFCPQATRRLATSQLRLKWNTQRRLRGTSPRRLSGTFPRNLIRKWWRRLEST